jgi:hypothetical protein
MEEAFGMSSMSQHYRGLAGDIRSTIKAKYWDEDRGLFADTHDHRAFSQHVNALAVLAGVTTTGEAARVMRKVMADDSLIKATIYFRYYIHRALGRAGLGDMLLDNLGIWRDQMALGLTTWAEMPEPSRSDCHAWGSSLNIEFYRILLGIDSDAPAFSKIRIAPSLGDLKRASGSIPHPAGAITVDYTVTADKAIDAIITLPEGAGGTFVWNAREYPIREGRQAIHAK